jgi:hypothetical protein
MTWMICYESPDEGIWGKKALASTHVDEGSTGNDCMGGVGKNSHQLSM